MTFRISLIIIGFVCTLYFAALVPTECGVHCPDAHQRIIANEFTSPWVYRVLTPFAAELLIRAKVVTGVYAAYTVLHMFLIPATLLALYEWLRLSMSAARAFGACMTFSFFLPLIFMTNYGVGAWSTAEVLFLCMSLLLLQMSMRHEVQSLLIALLTVISSLNRSSAILIPIAFFLTHFKRENLFNRRLLIESAALVGLCLFTLATVRWIRGPAIPMIGFPENVRYSIQDLGASSLVNNLLLLPLWILALVRWRHAPPFVKRMIWLFPVYIVAVILFGVWNEIRLWMPMFPLALAIVYAEETGESQSRQALESG